MSKTNSRALGSSGKSLFVAQHEGLEVKGDISLAVADDAVITTEFTEAGIYIVSDDTTENTAIISVINTAGTLSTVSTAAPTAIGVTQGVDAKMNVYIAGGFITVENKMGGDIDITVKPYV